MCQLPSSADTHPPVLQRLSLSMPGYCSALSSSWYFSTSAIHGQGFHFAVQNENHPLGFASSFLEVSGVSASTFQSCQPEVGLSHPGWGRQVQEFPLFTHLPFLLEHRGICGAGNLLVNLILARTGPCSPSSATEGVKFTVSLTLV